MSIALMAEVWKSPCRDASTVLLLLAMADYANEDGECWPSITNLGDKARLSERQCRYLLRRLETVGVIERLEGNGRNHTNAYQINLQTLQTLQPLPPLQGFVRKTLQFATNKPCNSFAPNPSSYPSEENSPSEDFLKKESLGGSETVLTPAPADPPPTKRTAPRKKPLDPDDWLTVWLQQQDVVPFAFLNDERWWAAASVLVTDGFNEAWLDRQWAMIVLHFQKPGESAPRTEAGWKRFLTHWLKLADKIEQREKRQEQRYGTPSQTRSRW